MLGTVLPVLHHLVPLHYGKLLGTRQTKILEAKIISILVKILGLYIQVERDLTFENT